MTTLKNLQGRPMTLLSALIHRVCVCMVYGVWCVRMYMVCGCVCVCKWCVCLYMLCVRVYGVGCGVLTPPGLN